MQKEAAGPNDSQGEVLEILVAGKARDGAKALQLRELVLELLRHLREKGGSTGTVVTKQSHNRVGDEVLSVN